MASSLNFTSNSFVYQYQFASASATGTGLSASSPNVVYDIMGGTTSYDRRIYGISSTNVNSASAQVLTMYLWDGTSSKQMFQVNVPANSGATFGTAPVDVFGNSNAASLFAKQKDANGVPYFNLPTGWSVRVSYNITLTGVNYLILQTFGETYQ